MASARHVAPPSLVFSTLKTVGVSFPFLVVKASSSTSESNK